MVDGPIYTIRAIDQTLAGFQSAERTAQGASGRIGGLIDRINSPAGAAAVAIGGIGLAIGAANRAAGQAVEIDRLATRAQLGAESFQLWTRVASRFGIEAEDVADTVREMQLRITEATELGTGPAVDALRLLNVELEDVAPLTAAERYALLRDRISQVRDEGQRLFIAEELLGGSSERLADLLTLQRGELELLQRQYGQGLISQEDIDRQVEYAREQDLINMRVGDFTQRVGFLAGTGLVSFLDVTGDVGLRLNEVFGGDSSQLRLAQANIDAFARTNFDALAQVRDSWQEVEQAARDALTAAQAYSTDFDVPLPGAETDAILGPQGYLTRDRSLDPLNPQYGRTSFRLGPDGLLSRELTAAGGRGGGSGAVGQTLDAFLGGLGDNAAANVRASLANASPQRSLIGTTLEDYLGTLPAGDADNVRTSLRAAQRQYQSSLYDASPRGGGGGYSPGSFEGAERGVGDLNRRALIAELALRSVGEGAQELAGILDQDLRNALETQTQLEADLAQETERLNDAFRSTQDIEADLAAQEAERNAQRIEYEASYAAAVVESQQQQAEAAALAAEHLRGLRNELATAFFGSGFRGGFETTSVQRALGAGFDQANRNLTVNINAEVIEEPIADRIVRTVADAMDRQELS